MAETQNGLRMTRSRAVDDPIGGKTSWTPSTCPTDTVRRRPDSLPCHSQPAIFNGFWAHFTGRA